MLKLFAIIVLAFSLQGCLFVVGATAGVAVIGGIVYDKRTAKATEEDKTITTAIQQKLQAIPEVKEHSHIVISTFRHIVLIAGQVPNQAIKDEVIAVAQTVPNIDSIYNELEVNGKPSALSNMSDTWVNTKVKTHLASENGLESSEIQTVTVNGTVYLMGTVTHNQGEIAVAIARNVSGVQKVVKIFTYDDPK
jgi:osmotically-inducible protein OsmY